MKRFTTAILFMAILMTCFSCADEAAVDETTTATESTDEMTATDDFGYVDPELPERDYGGEAFNIMYLEWSLYRDYYFADESNGEVVNDAVYERTRRVEEFFNIDIVACSIGNQANEIFNNLNRVVAAGLPEYDLALMHNSTSLNGYLTSGVVYNWNDIPGLDLDKPYWHQSVRENFEVDGILPFMSSDYVLPDINSIFFNKTLISEYKLENPYELVEAGDWTWDKLAEMAKAATVDLNGDSIMDDQDQYGFVGEIGWQFGSILTSCDQQFFGKGDDGLPYVACDNEKTQNILDKIADILYRGNCAFTWPYSSETDPNSGGKPPVSFDNNRALFYLTPLSLATTFRDTTVDYGILPLPKYDLEQDGYITLNWAGFLCVPAVVKDIERVGLVTEMLSAESCRTVMPAFYDVLLGEKIALDPDAQEMLDIMFENNVYDLGVNLGHYGVFHTQLEGSSSPNNSSYMASNKASLEKTISDYVEGCEGYIS